MGFDEEAGGCLLTAGLPARRPRPGVVSLVDSQICLRCSVCVCVCVVVGVEVGGGERGRGIDGVDKQAVKQGGDLCPDRLPWFPPPPLSLHLASALPLIDGLLPLPVIRK